MNQILRKELYIVQLLVYRLVYEYILLLPRSNVTWSSCARVAPVHFRSMLKL